MKMDTQESLKKQAMLMRAAETVFAPEILFTNAVVQDRILREPMVVICNHSRRRAGNCMTVCDGPLLRYVFQNKNVCSLMAKDLMEKPWMRPLLRGCDCIPVDRTAASTEWLRICTEKLKNGVSVIIFPEGTTLKDRDIAEFKSGFALLAAMAQVRVLPVAVNGEYSLFSKGKLKFKIGTPCALQCRELSADALRAEAERFQKKVTELFIQLQDADAPHEPLVRRAENI